MKLKHPIAHPAQELAQGPGQEEPAARTRADRLAGSGNPAGSEPKKSVPALSVHNLGKRFGDRVAFEDVSFEVGQGEMFGFLGPNGAGKTTTVRTLGTLLAPTSGSATVAGIPLTAENGVQIRRRIAVMPESPGALDGIPVIEIAEGCGMVRHTVRRWVARYGAEELADLADRCTPQAASVADVRSGGGGAR